MILFLSIYLRKICFSLNKLFVKKFFVEDKIYNEYVNYNSFKNPNIFLTASLDHTVIMWDLLRHSHIYRFQHSSIVTCICFHPTVKYNNY